MYYWFHVYQKLAIEAWRDITPMQYGYLLLGIGFCGWLLMRSKLL